MEITGTIYMPWVPSWRKYLKADRKNLNECRKCLTQIFIWCIRYSGSKNIVLRPIIKCFSRTKSGKVGEDWSGSSQITHYEYGRASIKPILMTQVLVSNRDIKTIKDRRKISFHPVLNQKIFLGKTIFMIRNFLLTDLAFSFGDQKGPLI